MKNLILLFAAIILSYTGAAQSLNLPYYTGFDTQTEKEGWVEYRTGFQSTFSWSMFNAISHDYNVGGNANDTVIDWMVSPALNVLNNSSVSFKISSYGFSTPAVDNCEVYYGTGSQDPSIGNFTLIANISDMQPQNQWLDTSVSIPNASAEGYIAFRYKTIGAKWMSYSIDSVTIESPVGLEIVASNMNQIEVFPNPVSIFTTLYFGTELKNGSINIIDINGKVVSSANDVYGISYQLDVSALSKGNYFLKIEENEKTYSTTRMLKLE